MCGGEDQYEIACQKCPRAFVCSALCSRAACRCDSPCRERCTQLRCCKDKRSLVASSDKNPHASCPLHRDEPPLAFVQEPSGACMLVNLQLAQRLQEFQVALVLLLQKIKIEKNQCSGTFSAARSFHGKSFLTACRNAAKYAKGQPLAGRAAMWT